MSHGQLFKTCIITFFISFGIGGLVSVFFNFLLRH